MPSNSRYLDRFSCRAVGHHASLPENETANKVLSIDGVHLWSPRREGSPDLWR